MKLLNFKRKLKMKMTKVKAEFELDSEQFEKWLNFVQWLEKDKKNKKQKPL